MRKVLILILLLALIDNNLLAEEDGATVKKGNLSFSITTGTGFAQMNVNEYVYDKSRTVSHLDWGNNTFLVNCFCINASWKNMVITGYANNSFKSLDGKVENSDWVGTTSDKTHYSRHDSIVDRYANYGFIAGYNLLFGSFILTPGIGYGYTGVSLHANDGYYKYPPTAPKEEVYGTAIIYTLKYHFPFASLGLAFVYNKLRLDLNLRYSCVGTLDAKDSHVMRSIDFYDSFKSLKYYLVEPKISYFATKKLSFFISCHSEYVPKKRGSSYFIDTESGDKSYKEKDVVGNSYKSLMIIAGVGFKI